MFLSRSCIKVLLAERMVDCGGEDLLRPLLEMLLIGIRVVDAHCAYIYCLYRVQGSRLGIRVCRTKPPLASEP